MLAAPTLPEHPASSVDDDPFIDTKQAAAIPGVHEQTIRAAWRAKRLRGLKINGGRVLRFRRSWVVQWLESKAIGG